MVTPTWLLARLSMTCDVWQRIPATDPDEYGNVVYDTTFWGSSACLLQPVTQQEIQLGRVAVTTMLLTLPAELDSVVDTYSAFTVDGVFYEATQPPAAPRSLNNTGAHHVEIYVNRSEDGQPPQHSAQPAGDRVVEVRPTRARPDRRYWP